MGLPLGLATQPRAQAGEPPGELAVVLRRSAQQIPGALDAVLGERPRQFGRIERVEEIVRGDVVGELFAVR